MNFSSVYEKSWTDPTIPKVNITFILKSGEERTFKTPVGVLLLEAAQHFNLDIEGACEASLACCTCHVILDQKTYDLIPPPCEREEDMLDLAPQLCETSRLSCQIVVDKNLEGCKITLPQITRNFYVDGFKPSPH
ncbi:2Fe-2S ferredoxin, putative [Cryptosporidium muris RN66]|uniref:2Fe-2S ferredoxin, putative n=1 Tax=Cryptosporidium muris (strain RN66) TaxID=441375 RepID=B6AIC1_CRYMR|nr:2Fe-2S ferredoxin, putative [Cryptosporidium muris RN66]EEA07962.1 2Fe-2S ferredoxin, putative [Cryptosporidium muris RN66]|eukprot:XP_002142311.1 2Fe-2S ferredoxin [Cryptosporidium muris RN66]